MRTRSTLSNRRQRNFMYWLTWNLRANVDKVMKACCKQCNSIDWSGSFPELIPFRSLNDATLIKYRLQVLPHREDKLICWWRLRASCWPARTKYLSFCFAVWYMLFSPVWDPRRTMTSATKLFQKKICELECGPSIRLSRAHKGRSYPHALERQWCRLVSRKHFF